MSLRFISMFPTRLNGNAHVQSLGSFRAAGATYKFDPVDGGLGVITGVTTVENVPRSRRVRLYEKLSGRLIRETFSNSVGQYTFANIDATREYFVVAHDHLRVYNAVVQDMLTP